MKYFKQITLFNQVAFKSIISISNYKCGTLGYLIYHFRTLVICPAMCSGDLIIWEKTDYGDINGGKEYN